MKLIRLLLGLLIILGTVYWCTRPCLNISGGAHCQVMTMEAVSVEKLEISFIHSVQKTEVKEYFTLAEDGAGFVLNSTHYHSFGVGLPFLEADGSFRQEGNVFIMDDMNRYYGSLSLRTGVGTQLTVKVNDKVYPLYEIFDSGEKIDIKIVPRYRTWLTDLL